MRGLERRRVPHNGDRAIASVAFNHWQISDRQLIGADLMSDNLVRQVNLKYPLLHRVLSTN